MECEPRIQGSRSRMAGTRGIPVAAMLCLATAFPGDAAGASQADDHGGALLDRVIEHYRQGELERAWDAYRLFFSDPSNRNVDVGSFGRCFYRQDCPEVGTLAYILGKSEAEAGDFRAFCPDWKGLDTVELSDGDVAGLLRLLRDFRYAALGGSCAEWVKANAVRFHPQRTTRRPAPQTVPLLEPSARDPRPVAEIGALGSRFAGLMDTGSTTSLLSRDLAAGAMEQVELLGAVEGMYATGPNMVTLARLDRLRLGNEVFESPVVAFEGARWPENGSEASAWAANVIGMNLLLQYGKVCFDWVGKRLHLGDLGPCAAGMTPRRSWLTGSQGIAVEAALPPHGAVQAIIDTGSVRTYCSRAFLRHNGGNERFAFGDRAALQGTCTLHPDVRFDSFENGGPVRGHQILLGMDTLKRFSAFGWELDPLKVYFAP